MSNFTIADKLEQCFSSNNEWSTVKAKKKPSNKNDTNCTIDVNTAQVQHTQNRFVRKSLYSHDNSHLQESNLSSNAATDSSADSRFDKLNKFAQRKSHENDHTSSSSLNGQNLSVFEKINRKFDEENEKKKEYRELMNQYMYRRPKHSTDKKIIVTPEKVDPSDISQFPSLNGESVKPKQEDSLSNVFDVIIVETKKMTNPWTNNTLVKTMEMSADKQLKRVVCAKKTPVLQEAKCISVMTDFHPLYADLMANKKLDDIENSANMQEELIDEEGFTKVSSNRKKKLAY